MTQGHATTYRVELLAAAGLFSIGGAAIKACQMTSWQVASFRSLVAAAAVLILLPSARRGWSWRTAAVGVAYAATMVLFVLSNKLTTAANTIFLQSTAPLYIVLLGPWLLKEPITRRDLGFMATLAVGMGLFFVGAQSTYATAPDPTLGNILGVASGLCWAATIVGLRGLGRGGSTSEGSTAAVALGNLLAGILVLPLALPVVSARPLDWGLIAVLGVFQIGLAYVFLTRGVRGVPALEASLLLLVEPILSPFWAWLVHGEQPTSWAILGGAIIVAATAVNTLLGSRRRGTGVRIRGSG
jgi:drug/metabolite transporter (DMT)-like permease